MNRSSLTALAFLLSAVLFGLALTPSTAHAQPEAPPTIAYQGYLTNTDGDPANGTAPVVFSLYDAAANGTRLWQETQPGVAFVEGIFSVHLGSVESLAAVPFGAPLWLGVAVAGGPELAPRVALEAVPYALGMRGLRVVPGEGNNAVLNLIGGSATNFIEAGISGAAIGGGSQHEVGGDYSSVGGGFRNEASGERATIGGGSNNAASRYATVGGGQVNRADGFSATIGGGTSNQATGEYATVAGGESNEATANYAVVGGGRSNRAEGLLAMVPGGFQSHATGFVSFAAGYNARALHDGTFVWTDAAGIPTPFSSTAEDQFLIRAAGGVGIGTNAPQGALHVTESTLNVNANGFSTEALVVEGSQPVVGVYAAFQANTRPGIVLAGVDGGNVVDKWGIVREFFSGNALHFTYGLNADHTQNSSVMTLSNASGNFLSVPDGVIRSGRLQASNSLGSSGTPAAGSVYQDNVVYAWAHVNADGSVASSYGCTVSKITGTGRYRVTFKRALPNGASAIVTPQTLNDPVIATAVTNANQADVATKVFNGAAFVAFDSGFYVQVVGRP